MKYIHVALMAGLLSGCIDSGSDESSNGTGTNNQGSEPTLSGLFKDTRTVGLDYKVGTYTDRTDELGAFKYFSEDDDITFSVGGVVLGTVKVSQVLTPIDLFVDGTSEKIDVQNIVSFLLALDDDADPSNGINITEAQAEEAKSWHQLDFSSANFETDVATIDTDIVLPTSIEAREHIEATYRCMYSGLWIGEYGGNNVDEGKFFSYAAINSTGSKVASYSTMYPAYQLSSSEEPVSYKNEVLAVTGDTSTGSYFKAEFPNISEAFGTWKFNGSEEGTLSSNRFNKDLTYQNRITASLSDSEAGYSQNTNYYIAVDIKDNGEYKIAVRTFNEELSGNLLFSFIPEVTKRIDEVYEGMGTLDSSGEGTLILDGINKKIKIDTDFNTNTVSILSDSDTTLATGSGSSCKLL